MEAAELERNAQEDSQMDKAGQKTSRSLLLPSVMCADAGHLADEIEALEKAGADGFHLDLMDGSYVPNFGMGSGDIKWIAKHASIPCDIHMMVQQPSRYLDRFLDMGTQVLYLHPESEPKIAEALQHIRERGAHPGIAVNPETKVGDVLGLLPLVDYVMVMTVHPGFAGQKWIHDVDPKIQELSALGRKMGFKIVIDGNCSPENIKLAEGLGARGFVLGTAGLFGHGSYQDSINALRAL